MYNSFNKRRNTLVFGKNTFKFKTLLNLPVFGNFAAMMCDWQQDLLEELFPQIVQSNENAEQIKGVRIIMLFI
jgi:hypothetical protein